MKYLEIKRKHPKYAVYQNKKKRIFSRAYTESPLGILDDD